MPDQPSTVETASGLTARPVAGQGPDAGPEDVGPEFARTWTAAASAGPYGTGNLQDFLDLPADRRRIVGGGGGNGPVLPFRRDGATHRFAIGPRLLGRMRVNALRLVNVWMAEGHPPAVTAGLLRQALVQGGADMLILGEIPETSDLRAALRQLSWPARALPRYRKTSQRWTIDLPGSLDDYLATFGSKTRKTLRYNMRRLGTDFEVRVETITDPAGMAGYLAEAERIGRRTYQWNLGQRLENTEAQQRQFRRLAAEGRLRCYLLWLDGTARAFAHGTVEGDVFSYETPGYDPDFADRSIGTMLFLYMVQDLIETRACRRLDFGMGGDEASYKSTFGRNSVACNSWYVLRLDRPRGMAVLLGETILQGTKNLADRILPKGEFRAALKRRLRRYGG